MTSAGSLANAHPLLFSPAELERIVTAPIGESDEIEKFAGDAGVLQ